MIDTITPRQREYALAYLADEPRAHTVARLGVTVGTVDVMRRRLRDRFGDDREAMRWRVETARVTLHRSGRRSRLGFVSGDAVEIIGGRFAGKRGEYVGAANSTQLRVQIGRGTFAVQRRFVHRDTA